MQPSSAIVSTYQLIASNGRPIRQATKVTFFDGRVVKFHDKLTPRLAVDTASEWLAKGIVTGREGASK